MAPKGKKKTGAAAVPVVPPASDEGSKTVMDEVELQRRATLVHRLREGSLVLFDAPRMMREVAAKKGQHYKALLQESKTAYDAMVRQKSKQPAEVDLGK